MKKFFLKLAVILFIFFSAAQFQIVMAQDENKNSASLTDEEKKLAAGSKAVILKSGFSAEYFDEHFKFEKVFNSPSDRRIVWRYSIGEYEIFVSDAVGFYTDENKSLVFSHSIGNLLLGAHDIKTVISKKRADELMKKCIGEYNSESVSLQGYGNPPRTTLVMTALTNPVTPPETNAEKERRLKQEAPSAASKKQNSDSDKIREGAKKKPIIYTGLLDLETGECTKGRALAGANPPSPN